MQKVDHATNIIEVAGVSFAYGDNPVLENISLKIHKGDYLGVVGPNGAGKTTLLKIMLGLLAPASGTIKLFGEDIKRFKDWSKIGYVPQKAVNFDVNFPASVEEIVLMGRYGKRGLFNFVKDGDREAVAAALKTVRMWDYRNRLIGDLSGGQQQRVFIARALAARPEVIFLDEPTSGVDAQNREEFYALLRKLNREENLTLVLVSHDLDIVVREAMHIACIDKNLVYHGSPRDYIKESDLAVVDGQKVALIAGHHHTHQ
jgi:zinc transport system ATP-binding protein